MTYQSHLKEPHPVSLQHPKQDYISVMSIQITSRLFYAYFLENKKANCELTPNFHHLLVGKQYANDNVNVKISIVYKTNRKLQALMKNTFHLARFAIKTFNYFIRYTATFNNVQPLSGSRKNNKQ